MGFPKNYGEIPVEIARRILKRTPEAKILNEILNEFPKETLKKYSKESLEEFSNEPSMNYRRFLCRISNKNSLKHSGGILYK